MESESVSTFCSITGASTDVAQGFLSLSGSDVSRAIELFFENPELASSVQTGVPAASAPSRSRSAGRQDSSGVIHIDSDDDDNFMQVDEDEDSDSDSRTAAAQAANLAQEEEDAAMAKRLQEELYQEQHRSGAGSGAGGGFDEEGVRAPIGRTTETLVAPDPAWGGGDDDDYDSALLNQLRRRRMPPGRSGGPFSQRIWGDVENLEQEPAEQNSSHARRLADLFRPPYDLMERGLSWDEARAVGKDMKKWIMVNLQDMNDFNCQALNRDIWKDDAVRSLVKDHFIFLQYDKDFPDAEEYTTFYFPTQGHENPDNFPHVSIIDPRTGEQVKVWSGRPFPSAPDFHSDLAEFLDRYSLEANSKNPVAQATAKKPQPVDVDRMTEEEMLEMALKNSMAGAGGSSGSSSTANVLDPDALTRASSSQDGGKGKEPEPPAQQSAFSQISNANPHTEPDNNPATTTRIQFRHPTGRVIRRFNLQDPVRRIFEWLKAQPLEGKDGVEFELKKMPQGQDLMDSLDGTIEENALKQGTVMIEFIEE